MADTPKAKKLKHDRSAAPKRKLATSPKEEETHQHLKLMTEHNRLLGNLVAEISLFRQIYAHVNGVDISEQITEVPEDFNELV